MRSRELFPGGGDLRRVVITGLGLVTPLGIGVPRAWQRLVDGACGIRALSPDDLPEEQRSAFDKLPARVAGMVPQDELQERCAALGVRPAQPRQVQFALLAAAEALQHARWQPETGMETARERTGVALGCGMSGGTSELMRAGALIAAGQLRRVTPHLVPHILPNTAAGAVSMRHGLMGPNHCASTACATGAHSIGDAYNFLRTGAADVMVAGATEACVDAVAICGFGRMRALETRCNDAPSAASRPFDAGRGGFVIAEGAGALVLEELGHALGRGAPILAEVRGYGLSSDAHHVTQPAPDGRGAALAMQRALAGAGASATDVAYVNAHATSTPAGDAVEAAAIARVFGVPAAAGAGREQPQVAVSSTKGATGHLLGAAGAVEAVFSVLALTDCVAPPTLNLVDEQPQALGPALVAQQSGRLRSGAAAVLTNSFGFGGTNASLLFARPPEP